MGTAGENGIVADGRRRLTRALGEDAARDEIEREVHARYERRLRDAGPLRRLELALEVRRAIRHELARLTAAGTSDETCF